MSDVLIVVDMQKDFIDGSLGTSQAQAIVPMVAEMIEQFLGAVYYTMDTHFSDYLKTQEGEKLPIIHCLKGTAGWKVHPSVLQPLKVKQAVGVEKTTFASLELMEQLQQLTPPTSITIIGLCTDICVINHALMAKNFFPEIPIRVIAAACAGTTSAFHQQALLVMERCQIEIV